MKNSTIRSLVAICFLGSTLINCNSSTKTVIKEDAKDIYINKDVVTSENDIAKAQKDIYSDFQKFIKDANLKLIKNSENISDLKQISLTEGNITNSTFNSKVDELEKSNNEFKSELDNYVANGSGNWKEFQNDFDTNLNELEIAFNQVKIVWQN